MLVLGVVAVLLLAGFTATALGAVAVARHRASAAADLAALAAAARAVEGTAPACAAGRRAAAGAGGVLRSCRLDGDVAEVVTVVRPSGWLGELGQATARARAGPAG